MKRFFVFFAMIAVIATITGCSSDSKTGVKEVVVETTLDTLVSYPVPITAPRYSCTGQILPDPKIIGKQTESLPITVTRQKTLSREELAEAGYFPGNERNIWGLFPGILGDILRVILFFAGIALLLLAVWLLWKLIEFLWNNLRTQREDVATHPVPVGTPAPTATEPTHTPSSIPPVIHIVIGNNATVGNIHIGIVDPETN